MSPRKQRIVDPPPCPSRQRHLKKDRGRIVDGHYDFDLTDEMLQTDAGSLVWDTHTVTVAAIRRERAALPKLTVPPETQSTPLKRKKFRRNLLIYWANVRLGVSHRFLADAFDLPKSRIGEILKEMERLRCSPPGNTADSEPN